MNIFIIHCHTANRGDEAAVHALVDELNKLYSDLEITLAFRGITQYPNMPSNVTMIDQFMIYRKIYLIPHYISMITKGRLNLLSGEKEFVKYAKRADLIVHAPGGPSIGDTYWKDEPSYLLTYDLAHKLGKPYLFYAPSMGPFNNKKRYNWRKRILEGAEAVIIRDPISAGYVKQSFPDLCIEVTLDSAFQHDVEFELNERKIQEYTELCNFMDSHDRCVGITITDLLWHPIYSKKNVKQKVINVFKAFLADLEQKGYGIVFIPQLYGTGNDSELMKQFMANKENYFIISDSKDEYDTYFQQHLISKMYAVVGMRYHSNIFSAKMGTPFISISYEQKMSGFMNKIGLQNYCISLDTLSYEQMVERYTFLEDHYHEYKTFLERNHDKLKAEAYRSTEILKDIMKKVKKNISDDK